MNICYQYLRTQGEKTPDKTAVICAGDRVSYSGLNKMTDAAAAGLGSMGIKAGSRVAILSRNSLNVVVCIYALWKQGACAVPVNFRENPAGIALMLDIACPDAVICADSELDTLTRALEISGKTPKVITETPQGMAADMQTILSDNTSAPAADVPAVDAALYIFTSGTMGVPKAAVHSSAALAEFSLQCMAHGDLYMADDVFLSYSPLCHIGGIRILLGNLMCGATLVLAAAFRPEKVLETIERERVTQMFVIPPALVTRLRDIPHEVRSGLKSVRRIRISGGLCSESAVDTIFELFPQARLISGYGSSEGMVSLFNVFDRDAYERDPSIVRSVGYPLAGNELLLLDESNQPVLTPGEVGRLYGKCPYMFSHYQTQDGAVSHGEWCDTGDMFYFDAQGRYFFKDRKKNVIKTGGENVFAAEVESVLNAMPEIQECAVFGIPNDMLGEAISAAIVFRSGMSTDAKHIIEFCRENMASYKKPVRIYFMPKLPKTATGKVCKYKLRDMAVSGKIVSEKLC